MTPIAYGMKTRTSMHIDATEARIREALNDEGFGVLAEIDAAASRGDQLGIEVAPYRILEANYPSLGEAREDADA